MKEILLTASNWSIPLLVMIIPLYGFIKGVHVYESFTEGITDGLNIILKIFPNLLAMFLAIKIFQYSGFMDIIVNIFHKSLFSLQIPKEAFPLLLLRSLSGSGSLAYVNNVFNIYGPDSFIGQVVSTIQGSTETTFYITAVYFGAVGIKKYKYSVIVGLLADISGFFAAIFICRLLFV